MQQIKCCNKLVYKSSAAPGYALWFSRKKICKKSQVAGLLIFQCKIMRLILEEGEKKSMKTDFSILPTWKLSYPILNIWFYAKNKNQLYLISDRTGWNWKHCPWQTMCQAEHWNGRVVHVRGLQNWVSSVWSCLLR